MLETIQTTHIIPYENIKIGNSTDVVVDKLIIFLEKYLPEFSQEVIFSKDENEINITYELRKYLQRKRRFNVEKIEYPFEFEREVPQLPKNKKGHAKATDVGVNLYVEDNSSKLIYCIEAKRLPTGKREREKEYLFGKKGGVQRFKVNDHGKSKDGNQLFPRNGMVGYVQENDFDHWHQKINEWIINEPTWSNTEILHKVSFDTIAKLESSHERISKDNLKLTHFWINLC